MNSVTSLPDLTFNIEEFKAIEDKLTLGSAKTFKLISGSYIIPIHAAGYHRVCFESPAFSSQGVMQSKTNTSGFTQREPNVFIPCSKDTSQWLDSFMAEFLKWAYPRCLNAIQTFIKNARAKGVSIPEALTKMLNAGPTASGNYVKDLWQGKDAFFLKILPQALVYTQNTSNGILQGRPVSEFVSDEMVVKKGIYKAHVVLRHLFLSKDDKSELKLQLSLQADQLYCISEDYPCPMAPVMNTDIFPKVRDSVDEFMEQFALTYSPPNSPVQQQQEQPQQLMETPVNEKKRKKKLPGDSEKLMKRSKTTPSSDN